MHFIFQGTNPASKGYRIVLSDRHRSATAARIGQLAFKKLVAKLKRPREPTLLCGLVC